VNFEWSKSPMANPKMANNRPTDNGSDSCVVGNLLDTRTCNGRLMITRKGNTISRKVVRRALIHIQIDGEEDAADASFFFSLFSCSLPLPYCCCCYACNLNNTCCSEFHLSAVQSRTMNWNKCTKANRSSLTKGMWQLPKTVTRTLHFLAMVCVSCRYISTTGKYIVSCCAAKILNARKLASPAE